MGRRKRPGHQRVKDFKALNNPHPTTELTSQMAVSHEVIAQLPFWEMVLRQPLESLKSKMNCNESSFSVYVHRGSRSDLLFKDSISEAASPPRCRSQPTMLPLHLAGLRRGLARICV